MGLKKTLDSFLIDISNLSSRIKSRDLLQLTVRTREEVLFEGEVLAISSTNEKGFFDVLPQHANFVTIIQVNLVVVKSNKEKVTFQLKTGLLKVWENKASVFLDVLEPVKI